MASSDPFLVTAIMGATNIGKSTFLASLESMLSGDPSMPLSRLSTIDLRPGSTQRMFFLTSDKMDPGVLMNRFGAVKPSLEVAESVRPGIPGYRGTEFMPKRIVFVDTPGIENLLPNQNGTDLHSLGLGVLKNSEVVVFIFGRTETGDLYHQQKLREAVKYWGAGRKVILAFNTVDSEIPPEKVAETFETMGDIFAPGFKMNEVGTEKSPIIGAYLFPDEVEVARGERAARLIPVGNSVEFPVLIDALNRSVDAVWQDVFGDIIRKIIAEARQSISDLIVSSLRVKLMRQTLDLMTIRATQHAISPFPYNVMREQIHADWNYVGSETAAKLRNAGEILARPELQLGFIRNMRNSRAAPSMNNAITSYNPGSAIDGVRPENELRVLAGINYLLHELSMRKLVIEDQFEKDPETMNLLKDIVANIAELTQLTQKQNETHSSDILHTGDLEIPLGTFGDVDQSLEKALARLARMDVDQHLQGILSQISQFQPPLTERAHQDLIRYLYDFRVNRSFLRNGVETLLVNAHVMVPTGVLAAELYAHYQTGLGLATLFNPLSYLLPANISARVVYWTDKRFLDTILKPEVQKWALARQKSVFTNYVNTYILRDIRAALDEADQRLVLGVEQGRRLLKILEDHGRDADVGRGQGLRLVEYIQRNDVDQTEDTLPTVDFPLVFRFYPVQRAE